VKEGYMSVISVNFKQPTAPASVNLAELKALAQKAAVYLGRYTGKPVKVEQVSATAFGAYVQGYVLRLGIVVGSYSTVKGMPVGEDALKWTAKREAAPREIIYEVNVMVEWLRDQSLATEGDFGREYANPEFKKVEDAAAWIIESCHKAPVSRISAKEVEEWKTKKVTVGIGTDKERTIPLAEAATIYGQVYRYEITAEAIATNHGISKKDALIIFAAVSKVLPKRKPPAEKT
jgi:hypothetical protein